MEFEEKYKGKNVDPNGLLENWTKIKPHLDEVLKKHKKVAYKTEYASDIEDFFILLQLFPSKQVGKNVTATSKNFDLSVEKLIQFELVL